jgi:endonuclease/exonuclease/phosphatase family metal-dependent hydrolase
MQLLSWNLQWCRGLDGRVDALRIAHEIRRLGDFDVMCLQEVADGFTDPGLEGMAGENQFAQLAAAFPDCAAIEGVAVDHPRGDTARKRFGNLILTRLPLGQVFRHSLPWPCDPGVRSMPRIAVEAVVTAPFGALRVVTTHLEYFSAQQRLAQVDALRTIYADGHAHGRAGPVSDDGSSFHSFPRPDATIVVGDFNMPARDPAYARMLAPFGDATPPLSDAWGCVHADAPQPPTFCVHVPYAPGMRPYACDFAFANAALAAHLRSFAVDGDTRASDHQPLIIALG